MVPVSSIYTTGLLGRLAERLVHFPVLRSEHESVQLGHKLLAACNKYTAVAHSCKVMAFDFPLWPFHTRLKLVVLCKTMYVCNCM